MRPAINQSQDRPLLGMFLMLCFCILAPLGDALVKLVSGVVPVADLLFVRFAVQALVLVPLVWTTSRTLRMRRRVLGLTFLRTLLHIAGIWAMFTALFYLPLADAVAIVFVMPFLMLILGRYGLGEEVGWRRLAACAVGFCGTLLVIQPSFAEVGWPALLPVLVAVIFAVFMLITRAIAREVDPISLQASSGLMATVLLAPALLWGPAGDSFVLSGGINDLSIGLLLLGIGGLGTIAHLTMTWSLRYVPAATVAPMQYLEIPFATIIGFAMFGDWPNALAGVGICLTLVAGVFIVLRERASVQARVRAQQAAPRTVQPAE